jgi:AAA+ ATPase superfamily predicted ATPase
MKSREVVLITGKTGSGKSTLFRELIQGQKRFIIFDTLSEYRNPDNPFPALFIRNIKDLLEYLSTNHRKAFRIVFDPEDPDQKIILETGETLTIFELTCKVIYEALSDVAFGVEEIASYVYPGYAPPYLRKIVRFGRHSSISIYATTQRPPEIPPVIRAQITKFISFRQHEPRDIEWIRQIIGDEASKLKNLKRFTWGKPMVLGEHYKVYEL